MEKFIHFLEEKKVNFKKGEPLKKHTTWKIGGPADVLVLPKNEEELSHVISFLYKNNLTYFLLGNGSNLLIQDGGIEGIVIKLNRNFEGVTFQGQEVHVKSGTSTIKLAMQCSKQGLSGLEFGGGIPGTFGGAIVMNAGAHGGDFSQLVQSVRVMKETGEIVTLSKEEMQFSYRRSVLSDKKWIVLEGILHMKQGEKGEIEEKTLAFKERRMATQPLRLPSCGSVFKNPLPYFAAKLIEEAGLKGYRSGDAQISELHANFIVNHGNATAKDVIDIIEHIQETVKKENGVDMVLEVKIIGKS